MSRATVGDLPQHEPLVLGLDPGNRRCGFAVVGHHGARVVPVVVGCWEPRARTAHGRLAELHANVLALRARFAFVLAGVERAFVAEHAVAALRLGEARGAILAALGSLGVEVVDLSPATVKSAVAGSGRATKEQVARAAWLAVGVQPEAARGAAAPAEEVEQRRKRRRPAGADAPPLPLDATDALAIAIAVGRRHAVSSLLHRAASRQTSPRANAETSSGTEASRPHTLSVPASAGSPHE